MAVRRPLYNDSGDIRQMTDAMIDDIIQFCIFKHQSGLPIALSVVSSGGNIGSIDDTRLKAGGTSTSVSAFPSEATTAEPSVVTVTYDKISETRATITPTADTGTTWPVYYTSGGAIQAMSLTDVKDTFLHPAIDLLSSGSLTTQQAGTYHINTSTSVTGSTEVSGANTAVFVDTRANTGA